MKKIIGIFVCMLLIVTALSVTGATNVQTLRNFWENNDLERNPITYPKAPSDSNGDIAIAIVAEVTGVYDPYNLLGGAINVGDKIKGKYIFDSTTPDSYPGYQFLGMYEHYSPPYGIELKCGGFVFKTDPNNVDFGIIIFNDFYYYYGDAYAPFSANNLDLPNGLKVDFIGWALSDPTGNALSSDALPTTAPVLSDWSQNELFIDGHAPSSYDPYSIEATVTKVTLSRSIARDVDFSMQPILYWLFDQFPNLFPILRQILDLN
jgi:hypothetical protein